MNRLIRIASMALALALSTPSFAADYGTREEAVAMVAKVIAYMKVNGKDKTIAEVNNLQSTRFRDRDLYITINDLNGKNLAHGANARMQGKDLIKLKDADGKEFMRERMQMAVANGKGWQDYKFVNPVSGSIEAKSMYFERYQDVIVNCGVYK